MIRAILFDFNGVLVDDEPVHFELFRRVLVEEGLDVGREEYWNRFLGLDDRGVFETVLAEAGRESGPEVVVRLVARKATYYRDEMRREGYPFYPGATELVRAASERDLTLGIVSGALRDEIEGALDQEGLRDLFEVVVPADDVETSKPDPEGYRRALQLLNSQPPLPARLLHPHEVLAVEDSPTGLVAASVAGLTTLGVAHTYPADELGEADVVVERIGDVGVEDVVRIPDVTG